MVRRLNYNFWKNKKVFITGHSGFKGSWMTALLIYLGAKVKGYSLPLDGSNYLFEKIQKSINSEVQSYFGNILDKQNLKQSVRDFQPDIIFHFAAQPFVRTSYAKPILTWETNVIGTLNILSCLNEIHGDCTLIAVTTDKVYKNNEWIFGYRENDQLGGHDPYSASKAACEIAISSWRSSFVSSSERFKISSVRAGNVIGGGDWGRDRIVPDVIKSLISSKKILLRNPNSKRPWQHVIEPLMGYLFLAENMSINGKLYSQSYNFGPNLASNKTVKDLVDEILIYWPGSWDLDNKNNDLHEAKLLSLQIEKAYEKLEWEPKWDFKKTVKETIEWYKNVYEGMDAFSQIIKNITDYETNEKRVIG